MGLLTRLAILPVLAVTLTGYFIEHWGDTLLERDPPFMYSIAFLLLLVLGPGRYSLDRVIERKLY
jgi:putative oxidoreductase